VVSLRRWIIKVKVSVPQFSCVTYWIAGINVRFPSLTPHVIVIDSILTLRDHPLHNPMPAEEKAQYSFSIESLDDGTRNKNAPSAVPELREGREMSIPGYGLSFQRNVEKPLP